MALKLENLRPQDKWDEETTWEELAAAMNPPMPQAWLRGLKSTHPDNATHACPNPVQFWRKYWDSSGYNDWRGIQNCLWCTLVHVTYDDPECYHGQEGCIELPQNEPRIDQIIALLAGLDANTNLNSTLTCTVISPFDRTRTEQRMETLDYNTAQADWDIQALRERLNSVKERTTVLEKRAERKRHRQERQRLKELERLKELAEMLGHGTDFRKSMAEFSSELRKQEEEAQRNAEALKRVEPLLQVTMMVPELVTDCMHCIIKMPWSHVQAKDGKAIFEFDGVNYELRRHTLNSKAYTGHTLE